VTELPTPTLLGLSREAVIAVPADGLTVYRLVRSDPPTARDFEPPSPALAELRGWPELHRAGLSHFLRPEQAERIRRSTVSRVAGVRLAAGSGIYIARTGRTPGHVTVWGRPVALLKTARIVG
jgi:hypothetical protein